MNAPMNPNSSNKTQIPMATDTSKRMGFNNFLRDVQGAAPTQPYVAPQMPTSIPQMAPNNPFMPQQQPMMPPSSQSLRGGIGMPMQPVQGFDNGGVAEDPIFAAVRANNEKARAEQEALAAYMASQATAGPTPLEIARAGYLADQVDEPVQAPMQTMDIGEPTFSGGSPVAEVPVVAPVADTGGISSAVPDPVALPTAPVINTFTPTQPTFSTGSPLPMENPNEEPVSTLTPMQQAAQALQNKIEEVGIDTFARDSDDDRNIRFADGTSLLDKDILSEFGVGKKEFLNYIDDLGVGRRNLFRTSGRGSEGNAFQQGLENILLSPEERAIAEQEYAESRAATLAAERAEKNKDERDAAQFKRAQDASSLKTGDGFLADLEAAKNDPFGGLDDIGRAILDGSLFTPKDDQTAYKSVYDSVFGGGDDTPSADPAIPDYLRMNQPIIGGGVIPDQAPSFGLSPGAMGGRSPLDLTGFEQRFGTDGDTAPNITSDLISLGDSGVGGVSPNINIDDGVVTSSGVLPSSLLGRIVGQESDDNFGDFDEMMGALENNSTRLDMRDLRRQELKKLTAEVDALAEAQGIPKYKDNGFETREYKTLEDDYYRDFSVPRIMQGRGDILDEFREGYGPGSKVTIRDDSPVIGGVPQLGTLQNFDFTNQLQDRDMGGLGGNQVDLSGLPANVQGLPPSQLQLQDELNELKKSQVADPEMDALMSGSAIPDYLTMNQPAIGGGVTPEFNEDDYTAITGRGGLPSYSKSMVNALMGAGGEDLSKAREQARSQKLNVDRFSGDKSRGNLDIFGTPFGESFIGPQGTDGTGGRPEDQFDFMNRMGYSDLDDEFIVGYDSNGDPIYRQKGMNVEDDYEYTSPDVNSLLQQFRDAQPEGALKGGAFDFVPDAEQLGNFMRGIIGPAGASTIDGFRNESTRGPDSRNIFTDMDGNPNVINPDGSITNITTGQTDYSGLDLSGLPTTIQDLPMSDASDYGTGVARVTGSGVRVSSPKSVSDLLDDIKTGAVTTSFYQDETIDKALPTNVKHGLYNIGVEISGEDPLSDGPDGGFGIFSIKNPDGSVDTISSNTDRDAYNEFMNGLADVDIPAGSTLVDNPNIKGTYQRSPDDKTSLDFFDDTQKPLEISLMSSDNPNNPFGQSAYNPNAVDLTKFMGGSGGLGSDMSPGTESNLLGDLGGFEQRFEDDTSIDSEIADLNNVSQLTDLTNLLTDSGLDAQTGNAISDTDAVEGLNILSSEFSDSDQSASSGDVLANILNTGDNAAAEAIESASGTAGSASGGDGEVGGGSGGLTDGDLDVIGDAIGEIAGGDASGSGTGSGGGSGSGSGDGGGGSGSGTGGTSTGGEGDGEGDDDGDGEGEGGGTTITVPPSGGDSSKSKQERRDYSRLREIIEQRARAPRGTAPGLGYKPVEGISNTLNKAADSFLDALRFG
tara:strand:+ start:3805 stop:8094 length:4290 start_codon:yes stop_codon:yes gene_type:complete